MQTCVLGFKLRLSPQMKHPEDGNNNIHIFFSETTRRHIQEVTILHSPPGNLKFEPPSAVPPPFFFGGVVEPSSLLQRPLLAYYTSPEW